MAMTLFDRLLEAFEEKGFVDAFDKCFLELIREGLNSDQSDAGLVGEKLIVNAGEHIDSGDLFWSFQVIGLATGTDYGTLWLAVRLDLKGLTHLQALTALLRMSLNGRQAIHEADYQAYDLLLAMSERDDQTELSQDPL